MAARAAKIEPLLKSHLAGVIGLAVTGRNEHYAFDGRPDTPTVTAGRAEHPDCLLYLSEHSLLAVASGSLNPQLGMLTDKIRVDGDPGLAVYFFNLVAPPAPERF